MPDHGLSDVILPGWLTARRTIFFKLIRWPEMVLWAINLSTLSQKSKASINVRVRLPRHYERVSNPSMRMEHKAGDKLFVDYTGNKLWIYPRANNPMKWKYS